MLVIGVVAGFLYLDGSQYLNLDFFNQQKLAIADFHRQSPLLAMAIYFSIYVLATAFSVPGAVWLTLAGGAIFGFGWGLLLVSFASTIGATLAFLMARCLLRDWVQARFSHSLGPINEGIERDGNYYLFTLRLVPLFPFVVINLVMALTPISTWRFYWVSQVGMLAATAVFVNAGTQLAKVDEVGDILSPQLLASFVILGLFPWLARKLLRWLKSRRILRQFTRPRHFDHNLIVIGAGSAGLVSALIAATVKASVALVEKSHMGGDCLNTGCVPSKALIRSSRINHYFNRASDFGLQAGQGGVDFPAVMKRVQDVIRRIEPHDSVERYSAMGVDCISGSAKLVSPWEVEVATVAGETRRLSARHIILATGAGPAIPDIPGLSKVHYLTSDTLWSLDALPQQLLVLGGGPVGCELAQAFARLGSEVTMLVRTRLLPREDDDVATQVLQQFERDGIRVLQPCQVIDVESKGGQVALTVSINDSDNIVVRGEQLLVATGRRPVTKGLGLENLGIDCRADGTIAVDNFLRTACPTVLACGDSTGPYQFTHVASHQAWYATVNALFGTFKKFAVDYSVIPWVTFCSPEVARVGLNEQQASREGVAYEVARYGIDDLDRAIADGEDYGFIKVLTRPGSDQILGVTIVGYHASELIAEYVLALKHDLGLNKVFGTIHIYPTLSEANKFVAGNWKKAHQPERLLRWVEWFHRLRR